MLTRKALPAILALLPLLVTSTAATSMVRPFDSTQIPVVVLPDSTSINAGASVLITVQISGTTTADQPVTLSSNSPLLAVPSSVTITAGHDSATFLALSMEPNDYQNPPPSKALKLDSSEVTVTATCNNAHAAGKLTVAY